MEKINPLTLSEKDELKLISEMKRLFEASKKSWGTDVTYICTQEGGLYLAVVMDLHSRRIVGWCIDKRMKSALVTRTLMMAINLRQPGRG